MAWVGRTPPTHSTEAKHTRKMNAPPRSVSRPIRATKNRPTASIGKSPRRASSTRAPSRTQRSAAHSIRRMRANSEGWKERPSPGTRIQRKEPFSGLAKGGIHTISSRIAASTASAGRCRRNPLGPIQ